MSNDTMTFPATVEEFMDKYKIVDVDQVYTNGAELVPIFRMKQWFEHCEERREVQRNHNASNALDALEKE